MLADMIKARKHGLQDFQRAAGTAKSLRSHKEAALVCNILFIPIDASLPPYFGIKNQLFLFLFMGHLLIIWNVKFCMESETRPFTLFKALFQLAS